MVTGAQADRHWISGMNWFHRAEQRYVEYGSSLEATWAFGLFRSLYDLVYNMNLSHSQPLGRNGFRNPSMTPTSDRVHAVSDLPRPPSPRGEHRGITGKATGGRAAQVRLRHRGCGNSSTATLATSMET